MGGYGTDGRSVREYLNTLDDAAWGAASPVKPKFISRSDPAAQWTAAHKGHAFFAYSTNYLIDLDHAEIVNVEPGCEDRRAVVARVRPHAFFLPAGSFALPPLPHSDVQQALTSSVGK